MECVSFFIYAFPASAILGYAISKYRNRPNVDAIPTIGFSGLFKSYITGLKFFIYAHGMIEEGYYKYNGMAFKVANLSNWHVIVSGQKLVEELRKAPDHQISQLEALNDLFKVELIFGHEIHCNPYHSEIIRSQLTRNLAARFSDIHDEIVVSFDELIPDAKDGGWVSVPALDTFTKIVCRATNRLFVGFPMCRDPDWIALNIKLTIEVFTEATIINMFPRFMAPLVAKIITNVPSRVERTMKLLKATIEERLRYIEEYGDDWAEKPQDMLTWLLDEARGEERSIRNLTKRILAVNIAAVHGTSMTFTHALYYLAANPQYIQPLREEVETIIETDGWSKVAMAKMRKVDSFLKESQRMEAITCLNVSRKVLKDFTFSDGTFVPAGCIISAAAHPTHRDKEFYENPDVFKPFRFADMREADGEAVRHQLVSTNPQYLPFGDGKHACPGRFFAATEMKVMLAHIVMTYDIKMEDEGVRPPNVYFGTATTPNNKAKVMFRKRQ